MPGLANSALCASALCSMRLLAELGIGVQVHSFVDNKPMMAELQDALCWNPPPISVRGWEGLQQGFSAAQEWQQRASQV